MRWALLGGALPHYLTAAALVLLIIVLTPIARHPVVPAGWREGQP